MALIGISGKAGSGKDTVGKIIQYLTSGDCSKSCLDLLKSGDDIEGHHNSNWKIKKFAGKLKQIVSILTGIPVEDLEKEGVKNKVLGEEWWYFKVYSDIRQDKFELVPYKGEEGFYDRKENYKGHSLREPTVRQLLQEIGTGAMRNVIHPNIWVNALFADYKPIGNCYKRTEYSDKLLDDLINFTKGGKMPNVKDAVKNHNDETAIYPNWIITDLRFPNELEAIKQRDGITIRVHRDLHKGNAHIAPIPHPLETALDNAEFDYVIDNSGSINDLIDKVRDIVKDL